MEPFRYPASPHLLRHDAELFARLTRYPDDLPDLPRLRPPGGNARPEGIGQSHFALRKRGELKLAF